MRLVALGILLAAPLVATGCGAATAEDAAPKPPAAARPWLDPSGTSIVGFGLLRVVPPAGGGSFRIRYRENPTEYSSGDQFQLFVLPGNAYATKTSAYAGEYLAFARTDPAKADGYADLEVTFRAAAETTVLVAYGPWTAPDAGRPPGDRPTFTLDVTSVEPSGAYEWAESEAGELITTNWTNRPEVKRGAPAHDPISKSDLFVEVRPMILYDPRMVRTSDEGMEHRPGGGDGHVPMPGEQPDDMRDRELDDAAVRARADHRIPMTRELAEKFRRVPIRWR